MDLHLNVKAIYFDEHVAGDKVYEYRLYNEYWKKRLIGQRYDKIYYKSGYPKKGDTKKIRVMPYHGYTVTKRQHPHFGDKPVEVFAIKLEGAV